MGNDGRTAQSTDVLATSHPPPWCKWFILAISFIMTTLVSGVACSFGVLFVELLKEFNKGKGQTAAVGSVALGLMYGIGPVAGGLCKRWGTRIVSVVGALLSFTSLLISGYSQSLGVLYGTYSVLAGIGFGFLNLSCMLCVAEHFGKKMGLACALTSSGSGVGNLIFPIIINNLIQKYGWRQMLTIVAGIQIITIICSVAMFLESSRGYICSFRKHPESKDKKTKKKMSIPSLYPTVYEAFKLFLGHTNTIDSATRVSSVVSESRDDVVNSPNTTSNYPCGLTNHLNQTIKIKENSEQNPTENKTENSSESINTPKKNNPVREIFIDVSSFTHQTTQTEQPIRDLSTPHINGNCADQHVQQSSTPPAKKKLLSCNLFAFGNVKYFIFLTCCLFSATGAGVPPIIISDHARSFDISPEQAAILVSVIGVTGTVGRLLAGVASCRASINIVFLYMVQMFIGGVATIVTPLLLQYWFTILFSASFGLFYGVTAGLDPSILAKFIGKENMAMGYGFFSLILGVGSGISAPIAGLLRDLTGNYNCSFYVAGFLMVVSSIFVFSLYIISRTSSKDLEFKERRQSVTLIQYKFLH